MHVKRTIILEWPRCIKKLLGNIDNQWNDNASLKKSFTLIDSGESVFIWPETFKTFKDLNEVCIKLKRDKVDPIFIQKNTYSGLKAKFILTNIKNKREA